MKYQSERYVFQVVSVDVMKCSFEEILLGRPCGDLRAPRILVPFVLREGIVLAAHPYLAPHHSVRLAEKRDRGEQEHPEHFAGGCQDVVEALSIWLWSWSIHVPTGEEQIIADCHLQQECSYVPRFKAILPERNEGALREEGLR
eukprot:SAG31_NODE_11_length_38734_cov_21.263854_29_plen_144_part_00